MRSKTKSSSFLIFLVTYLCLLKLHFSCSTFYRTMVIVVLIVLLGYPFLFHFDVIELPWVFLCKKQIRDRSHFNLWVPVNIVKLFFVIKMYMEME
jgi:hypothetical protein